jgi:hypothetical protein
LGYSLLETSKDGQFVGSTATYAPLAGWLGPATALAAEGDYSYTVRQAGTMSQLFVVASANASTLSTTVNSRKNGGNGNLSVSIPSGGTGAFEDMTDSDSFVSGDTADWQAAAVAGSTGATTLTVIAAVYSVASGTVIFTGAIGHPANTYTPSTTTYSVVNGFSNVRDSTEANWQVKLFYSGSFTNLHLVVTANSITDTSTARFRKNSTNGSQSVSIPGSTTGDFEDTTDTDSFASGDLLATQIVAGAGGTSMQIANIYYHALSSAAMFGAWTGSQNQTPSPQYVKVMGGLASGTGDLESADQTKLRVIGATFSNLSCYKQTTNTGGMTVNFRKNGANGNESLSMAAAATGQFSDSVDTDVAVPGDLLNYKETLSSSTFYNSIGSTVQVVVVSTGPQLRAIETGSRVYVYKGFTII